MLRNTEPDESDGETVAIGLFGYPTLLRINLRDLSFDYKGTISAAVVFDPVNGMAV